MQIRYLMFGGLQLAPIYYYNVPTPIGNVDESLSSDNNIIQEDSAQ